MSPSTSTIVYHSGRGGRSLWLRFLLVAVVVGWNESSICHMNLKALTIFLSLSNTTAFTPRRAFGTDYTASALVPKKYQALDTKNQHQAIIRQQKSISSVQRTMGSQSLVYGTAVATTFGIQTIGFVAAYLLKTETCYDIVGSTNYILLALLSAIIGTTGDGALPWVDDPRKILTTVLFACSRGWLLLFLAWRAHERKGDSRFDEVLGKNGNAPQPLNFFVYWMVQGIWVMLVSMPMLFVNSSNLRKQGLSVYDIACTVFFGSGLLIEVVADFQKAKWVKRGRQGFFCDVGLWKYSREF